ncbi:hypothetical protein LUZ60_008342 [Juncus effusus]|nr:hypothetical protein LUZ60_008342 [Juncus effusus]
MAVSLPAASPSPAATKDPHSLAGIRRSRSEPVLRCSSSLPRAGTLKTSQSISQLTQKTPFNFPHKIRSVLFETSDEDQEIGLEGIQKEGNKSNWVERLLELREKWQKSGEDEAECYCCNASYDDVEEEDDKKGGETEWDRDSFARLLARVAWSDTKLFSQLAYLCNMAYFIPQIKEDDLKKYYGLRLVTSSLEKKSDKSKLELDSTRTNTSSETGQTDPTRFDPYQPKRAVKPSVAYEIAASAASYIHSRAKGLLSITNNNNNDKNNNQNGQSVDLVNEGRMYKSEVAAYVAASTMTAMVAAQEAARLEAAADLRSVNSSPCEWFVCDDRGTRTRNFIIQGSDSLASWQANLFFEPTEFEDTGVLVHRGIYEAAKGIFQQLMPLIQSHIQTHGPKAKLRFAGHSLGGSLSLVVSLMLLTRKLIPSSSLLPVVTFGAPSIFCGGFRVLEKLGLDDEFVKSVVMHRDIVPRAFSCSYPSHVASVLRRVNGAFRSHPCLNNEKVLYSPLGKIYILQPDSTSSPHHPYLPEGSAFYTLEKQYSSSKSSFNSAINSFFNTPHPLETLSDLKAYGSDGTILRDHESGNYFKAINGFVKRGSRVVVRKTREERLMHWWPLIVKRGGRNVGGIAERRNWESGKEVASEA